MTAISYGNVNSEMALVGHNLSNYHKISENLSLEKIKILSKVMNFKLLAVSIKELSAHQFRNINPQITMDASPLVSDEVLNCVLTMDS